MVCFDVDPFKDLRERIRKNQEQWAEITRCWQEVSDADSRVAEQIRQSIEPVVAEIREVSESNAHWVEDLRMTAERRWEHSDPCDHLSSVTGGSTNRCTPNPLESLCRFFKRNAGGIFITLIPGLLMFVHHVIVHCIMRSRWTIPVLG